MFMLFIAFCIVFIIIIISTNFYFNSEYEERKRELKYEISKTYFENHKVREENTLLKKKLNQKYEEFLKDKQCVIIYEGLYKGYKIYRNGKEIKEKVTDIDLHIGEYPSLPPSIEFYLTNKEEDEN